jgi:transcription antitermination factor NusG
MEAADGWDRGQPFGHPARNTRESVKPQSINHRLRFLLFPLQCGPTSARVYGVVCPAQGFARKNRRHRHARTQPKNRMTALAAAPAAGPLVSRAPLVSSLPAWLVSAGDIDGELAGVQVYGGKLAHVVRHLERERVDFYYPRERVVRFYNGQRREYDRAFIPGCFFVGKGEHGRDKAYEFADFMGWRVKFIVPPGAGAQAELRKEVADLGTLLYDDPALTAYQGLRGGDRCRVAHGPFMNCEGYIESDGTSSRLWVRLTIFGQSVPVEVPVEYLERI